MQTRQFNKRLNNDTLEQIVHYRTIKFESEKQWRKREVDFRKQECHWWNVDKKRLYTDQLVEQLSVLSELSAFASGFQMVMLYELELPSLEEFQYHHAFLSIWGLVCLVVCCANMCVFFLSVLAAIDILNYSARESPWSLAETEMLSPPACPVRGTPEHVFVFDDQPALDTAEQMHVLWCQKHERRAKILWKTVSYCMPAFLLNAGFSTIAKFYMAPAAGWTGFVVSFLGMIVGLFWLVMPKTFDRSVDGQESNVTE